MKKKQLKGLYGEISNQVVKGFCTICNKESNVSLFMKKSKTNSDGQYVKKVTIYVEIAFIVINN